MRPPLAAFWISIVVTALAGCGEGVVGGSPGGQGGQGGPGGSGGGGGGGFPPDPEGEVTFNGDFETGDLSQWSYIERCANDRIQVYTAANLPAGAPPPREGKYAVRFHVLDSDVEPCTSSENPRAELETPEELFKPGDDRWEAWSMYIPANTPEPLCGACVDRGWFVIQEDYGAPFDGSPSIGWNLDFTTAPHTFRMDRGEQYNHDQPGVVSMIKGRWIDLLVHKKFANTANGGGFVEAWVDGTPLTFKASGCNNCTRLMTQTMHSTQRQVGFYLLAYRERGYFSSFDIYYDAVRIGTTRDAVELLR